MGALAELSDRYWLKTSDEGVPDEAAITEVAWKMGFLNALQVVLAAGVAEPDDPERALVAAAMTEAAELLERT